jgi:hypothetical protein
MQNFDHNIGFWEKRQFFRQRLSKIAENCDHNIDPWTAASCIGHRLHKRNLRSWVRISRQGVKFGGHFLLTIFSESTAHDWKQRFGQMWYFVQCQERYTTIRVAPVSQKKVLGNIAVLSIVTLFGLLLFVFEWNKHFSKKLKRFQHAW